MSPRIKNRIKEILFFIIVLAGLFGWATVGYEMGTKKQIIVEKPVLVPVELDDPRIIEIAIQEASEKYGIRKRRSRQLFDARGGRFLAGIKRKMADFIRLIWKHQNNTERNR
jgi:hypothetical protein